MVVVKTLSSNAGSSGSGPVWGPKTPDAKKVKKKSVLSNKEGNRDVGRESNLVVASGERDGKGERGRAPQRVTVGLYGITRPQV